jgi:DNA-binding GntR family transcriptional regulator
MDPRAETALDPRLLLTTLDESCCAIPAHVAGRLGVDEAHVGAALDGLEQGGLVRRDGDGSYHLPPESVGELRELYVVAILLEGLALRSAARFGADGLQALRDTNDRLRTAADTTSAVAADDDFHRILVAASGNERLRATHAQTKAALLRYEQHYFFDAARRDRSARRHDEIIAALEAGNHAEAAEGVRRNFEDARPDIEDDLSR